MTTEQRTHLRRAVIARERELAEIASLLAHPLPRECAPASAPWRASDRDAITRDGEPLDFDCYRIAPDGSRTRIAPTRDARTHAPTPTPDRKRAALDRLLAIIGTSQADYD